MYIEINTATKIDELELAFGDKRQDMMLVGVPYAWAYKGGRYLISLMDRGVEEMRRHIVVAADGRSFELPILNQRLKNKIIFKPVETRWRDEHKDETVRWIGRHKGIPIHISDAETYNFFPYVSRTCLSDLKPYESLCEFMLRQSTEIQNDVFTKLVMDFCFPEIADWVKGGCKNEKLTDMFRAEHKTFVEHMLGVCKDAGTLEWIGEYIRHRNDASIALNSIIPEA